MRTSLRACLLALAVALGLTACGGSSSGGGTAPSTSPSATATTTASPGGQPADPAAAKAEITRVWEKFFNSSTKGGAAASLLEDGDQLGAALKLAAKEDRQTKLDRRAKVKSISFFDASTANVTWTLLNKTTPVLDNASGQAKLINGHWLVSKLTFCTLVELGNNGKPVPGCS
jgi:hypothetical protein